MKLYSIIGLILLFNLSCNGANTDKKNNKIEKMTTTATPQSDTATFGAGCFWCAEAIFSRVNGVIAVVSGYSGGKNKNPTYKEVCSGQTGHAEVCQIIYDPKVVTYDELLQIFWQTHDPTTLNKQGADEGTQYRSVIFYFNEEQKEKASYYKEQFNKENTFGSPVVTEITPFTAFYQAEDYHQDYFEANPKQPYCSFVIAPKVEKFEKIFKDKLKQ